MDSTAVLLAVLSLISLLTSLCFEILSNNDDVTILPRHDVTVTCFRNNDMASTGNTTYITLCLSVTSGSGNFMS